MLVPKVKVRKTTTKKPKKLKKPTSLKKHGGQEHFTGKKNEWIEDKVPLFIKAQDVKKPGAFYTWVARQFIIDWGDDGSGDFTKEPDGPDDGDLNIDVEDVDAGALALVTVDNMCGALTQEEADAAAKRFDILRDVSIIFHLTGAVSN